MPDISMCAAKGCALSKQCYRHKDSGTKPNEYQAYFMPSDDRLGNDCDMFWARTAEVAAAHDGTF